jgi:hypothetical protein
LETSNRDLAGRSFAHETGWVWALVVNRAYYAAFYAVTAVLELDGRTAGKHSGIISLFDVEYVKSGRVDKAVSKKLHALFERRQEDDYAGIAHVSNENAQEAMQDAAEIMKAIHYLLLQALPDLPVPPKGTA